MKSLIIIVIVALVAGVLFFGYQSEQASKAQNVKDWAALEATQKADIRSVDRDLDRTKAKERELCGNTADDPMTADGCK